GLYYLQAYTNYMNNFSEDESSVFAIEIINPTENKVVENKFNAESAQIGLYPESGVFLKGVTNTFGVRLTDCNDRGLAVSDATVKDSKGNLVTTFSTNSFGYGKFDLINAAADIYTVSAVI